MITVEFVKNRMDSIVQNYSHLKIGQVTKDSKKAGKEFEKLKSCLYYLESSPNESFLKSQLESLENKLKLIDSQFSEWIKHQPKGKTFQQLKTQYNSLMETKKIKDQIKTLEFILE